MPTTSSVPYDCEAGLDEWVLGWSDEKKRWCCSHRGKGCSAAAPALPTEPFDCAMDYSDWAKHWSYRKKAWCCRQYARGCHVASADSEPYECEETLGDLIVGWLPDRKDYCCRVHGHACPTTTVDLYDCTAGFSTWQIGWSFQKQEWCCRQYARGCAEEAPPRQELVTSDSSAVAASPGQADYSSWPETAVTPQQGLFEAGGQPFDTGGGRAPGGNRGVRWRPVAAQAVLAAGACLATAGALSAAVCWRSGRGSWRGRLSLWEALSPGVATTRRLRRLQDCGYCEVGPDAEEPLDPHAPESE